MWLTSTLLAVMATSTATNDCGVLLPARLSQGQLVKAKLSRAQPSQAQLNQAGPNQAKPHQSNPTVSYQQKSLKLTTDGHFVFGIARDQKNLQLTITQDGKTCVLKRAIAARKYRTEVVNGVPQSTVTPDDAQKARIERESALITSARAQNSDRTDWLANLQWPATGRISGVYGSQRIVNKLPLSPHMGLDIAAATGTPIYAPWSGKVSLVHNDMLMTGGTLLIDHGYGVSTIYIHLSKVLVQQDEVVKPGQLIAKIGATGRASGPHLHFQVQWFQEKLDPTLLLPAQAK